MSKNVLLILLNLVLFTPVFFSQNLVLNNSFEEHGAIDCVTCPMWPEKFAATLPHWKFLNGNFPYICDCRKKQEKVAIERGVCMCRLVSPKDGHSMMQLEYMPSCFAQNLSSQGCSSYLATKLSDAIEIGKIYEVSFWLYIPLPRDRDFANNIGINLFSDIVRNPNGQLLYTSLFIDKVVFNEWFQVKWKIRPICKLQFLVIGVFKGETNPPINNFGHHNMFYIDHISIAPIKEKNPESEHVISFCKPPQKETVDLSVEIEGASVFFNLNDTSLSIKSQIILDSFAERIKKFPKSTFSIAGNTDNSGTDHLLLSKLRVENVIKYLESKHKIKSFRFLQLYFGESNPVASNDQESGRQQNRRVDIHQIGSELPDVLYRNLLLSVFDGNIDKSFELINIWLHVVADSKKIYLLFDSRLKSMTPDTKCNRLVLKQVKDSYRKYKQPDTSFLLDSLGKEDQKCRSLSRYIENLNAYYEPVDSLESRFNASFTICANSLQCEEMDAVRFNTLKRLVGLKNWPKSSEVGERSVKSAFLILSHSNDSSALKQYLPDIKERCIEGEAEWIHYATLYDRLQVMRGLPQRFGTQYKPLGDNQGKLELFPLEDPNRVNEWRKELGIDLLNYLP